MPKNLKVGTRLGPGFGLIVVMMVGVVVTAVIQMRAMATAANNVYRSYNEILTATQIADEVNNMRRRQFNALVLTSGYDRVTQLDRVTAARKVEKLS